jgi:hypothetical protein
MLILSGTLPTVAAPEQTQHQSKTAADIQMSKYSPKQGAAPLKTPWYTFLQGLQQNAPQEEGQDSWDLISD